MPKTLLLSTKEARQFLSALQTRVTALKKAVAERNRPLKIGIPEYTKRPTPVPPMVSPCWLVTVNTVGPRQADKLTAAFFVAISVAMPPIRLNPRRRA